ncbi:MAG: hypothetical protein IKL82_04550 [Clostridia bacterium]|nr:hypothetical protein [Clostridia bacterium]
MFGYLKPDNPYLYLKDETLYKALYCGVCKSIGKTCGELARFTLTYDIAFLSAIAHNIMGEDVKIERQNCVAHPFKKRPVALPDDISNFLGAINVILAYYKLKDDVLDEKKSGVKSSFLKPAYKKAKKIAPEVDKAVSLSYKSLVKLESENNSSIDVVCDPFATMLQEVSTIAFGDFASEYTRGLFYAIGKWIYLIDALDDYDKDIKKKNYNVLRACYGANSFELLITEHKNDIVFIFNGIFMQILDNYNNIPKKYNTDLVVNILTRGIPETTRKILEKGKVNE